MRRPSISRTALVLLAIFVVVAWMLTDASPIALLVAALAVFVLFKIGFAMLGGLAQPVPEPPPAGRAAQGEDHVSVLDLRHRGADDRGQRPDAGAAPSLPRGHGARDPGGRPLGAPTVIHRLWMTLGSVTWL